MKGISSWRTHKVRIGVSSVAGKGLFAVEPIAKDEVVAVKGGHIMNHDLFMTLSDACKSASLQLSPTLHVAPLSDDEIEDVMVYVNHTCEPNVGLRGHLETVAMRDIEVGEELTGDYCIAYSNDFFEFDCQCGTASCRKKITSADWQDETLQRRYAGYFCQYIQTMIDVDKRRLSRTAGE